MAHQSILDGKSGYDCLQINTPTQTQESYTFFLVQWTTGYCKRDWNNLNKLGNRATLVLQVLSPIKLGHRACSGWRELWSMSCSEENSPIFHPAWMRAPGRKSKSDIAFTALRAGRMIAALALRAECWGSRPAALSEPTGWRFHCTMQHSHPQVCSLWKARDLQWFVLHPLGMFLLLSGKGTFQRCLVLGWPSSFPLLSLSSFIHAIQNVSILY